MKVKKGNVVKITAEETVQFPILPEDFYTGTITAVRDTTPKGEPLKGGFGNFVAIEVAIDGHTTETGSQVVVSYLCNRKFNERSKLGLLWYRLKGTMPKAGDEVDLDALVGVPVKVLVRESIRTRTFQGKTFEQKMSRIEDISAPDKPAVVKREKR